MGDDAHKGLSKEEREFWMAVYLKALERYDSGIFPRNFCAKEADRAVMYYRKALQPDHWSEHGRSSDD